MSGRTTRSWAGRLVGALAAASLLAAGGAAGEEPGAAAAAAQADASEEARVEATAWDWLRALSPELAAALSRSTEGLEPFPLPGGGRGFSLDGRFQHVLMARALPDGGFEFACVDQPQAAAEFLYGPPAAPAAAPPEK